MFRVPLSLRFGAKVFLGVPFGPKTEFFLPLTNRSDVPELYLVSVPVWVILPCNV